MNVTMVIAAYIFFMNLLGLGAMYSDKQRAKKRAFRIPESTLFTIAVMGGSIGAIAGMYLCHHKTRHWRFVYGLPLILVLQIAGIAALFFSPIEILTL